MFRVQSELLRRGKLLYVRDYDHAFRFMDSPGGQKMLDAYQRMDLQGMGFFPTGFRQFTNNKRPIETVEDLKGLKIRGYSPVQIAAWEALGLNLTAVNWNELFTSMQQNLIDGQESALSSIFEQKFYEVQNYISLTSHLISSDILVCNQTWFDSLTSEDQNLITEAVANAVQYHRETLTSQEKFLYSGICGVRLSSHHCSTRDTRQYEKDCGCGCESGNHRNGWRGDLRLRSRMGRKNENVVFAEIVEC